jgi:hypothetical protein
MMQDNAPSNDEIEVSVFSLGYGESIVIHVGQGVWLVVDSLLSNADRPAALEYFESIEVDYAKQVSAVLLTHWHDDHVGGAAQLVQACTNADVALSQALRKDEFRAFLRRGDLETAGSYGSGVQELLEVLRVLREQKRTPKWSSVNRLIKEDRGNPLYRFEALSPSDADFEKFLQEINRWSLEPGRLNSPQRNDASVAAVIEAGGELLLLGADIEKTSVGRGWQGIVDRAWAGRPKASFYKIAHHGSPTGEYAPVWAELLVQDVTAALTPWSRGSKLPSRTDVERILSVTNDAHSAARVKAKQPPKRLNSVERSIRESGIKIESQASFTGHVRFRKTAGTPWRVQYVSGDSCHLSGAVPVAAIGK